MPNTRSAFHSAPPPDRQPHLVLLAVGQLDVLVGHFRDFHKPRLLPESFLDWIADIATPHVEHCVCVQMRNSAWAPAVLKTESELVISLWVLLWLSKPLEVSYPELIESAAKVEMLLKGMLRDAEANGPMAKPASQQQARLRSYKRVVGNLKQIGPP
jgi:hypothetical protein